MYAKYTNEELRRVLATNPKDAEAIVEAADRFLSAASQEEVVAAYDRGYEQGQEDAGQPFDCPECGAEIL
jgi:hypothetical protein